MFEYRRILQSFLVRKKMNGSLSVCTNTMGEIDAPVSAMPV